MKKDREKEERRGEEVKLRRRVEMEKKKSERMRERMRERKYLRESD